MMFLFKKASILTFSILCVFAILAAGCGNGGKASSTDTPASSSAATAAPTTAPVKKGPSKIVVTYFPYADHLFALGKADAVAGVVNLKSLQDFPVYDTFLKSGKVANLGEKIDFEKLGFKPFEGMKNVGDISLEGISELNPEYIFIGKDYTNTSEVTLDSLNANPIWNSLTAVKNKKMFVVDTEILGPLAMGQVKGLDYMSKLFSAK
jgi:ABC-type Fe3+-hydroxamate transport system substrate-binding protein